MNAHDFWLKVLKDCYEYDFPIARKVKVITFPTDRGINLQYHDMVNDLTKLGGRNLGKGDVLMDIGACVGMWSFWAACLYPEATIYAYEPMPHNYDNLCEGIKLNGFENIIPLNHAISHSDENLLLYQHPLNSGSGSIGLCNDKDFEPFLPQYNVQAKTLKQAMTYFGIQRADVVKMDIEGAEYKVLESLDKDTWDSINYMSLELHGSEQQRAEGIAKYSTNKKVSIV